MTIDAATKPYALAKDRLRNTLAASATFQQWVGAESAAEAKERIYLTAVPPPDDGQAFAEEEIAALVPLAVIWTKAFLTRVASAVGAGACYDRGSDLVVDLVGPVDPASAGVPAECGRKFDNIIGGIIADLETLNGEAELLAFRQILIQEEPERGAVSELPTRGDLWRARLVVTWQGA